MKEKQPKGKPHGKRRYHGLKIANTLMAIILGIELVIGLVGVTMVNSTLHRTPSFKLEKFSTSQSTLIYDREGKQIADVGNQLRENVTYDQLPTSLVDAFLSVEDSRFFVHNGFDAPRFTKSIIETILRGNMQGGSTFTMQLVKLSYFVNDETGKTYTQSIDYKIQQIALALKLENNSSKKDIFTMYVNKMNFGGIGNIRGVQKASRQYFGKNVSELNTSESALLAGIVNSPYSYDPHNYLDRATKRRNTVLDLMAYHGYISKKECQLAKSIKVEDLLIDAKKTLPTGNANQAYIDAALKEAQEVTGQDPLSTAMEIHTSLDQKTQALYERIQANKESGIRLHDRLEVCGISINNQNGEIVAIGGGRNWSKGGSQLLNRATQQYNQPGSAVKPFLDYALAFEDLGWSTGHELVDKPVKYGNWTYRNANGKYFGRVNLKKALNWSLNTPAIQAFQAVQDKSGLKRIQNYLVDQLHFKGFNKDEVGISYAIGGGSMRVTAEQLAAAHAIMMNGGNYIKPHTITSIHFRNGDKADYKANFQKEQVISSAAAYMTAYLMETNVSKSDVYNYMQILKRSYPVYAKTGTTDWGSDGLQYGIPKLAQKDKWMVAETSQYTSAVWIGFNSAEKGKLSYVTSSIVNQNIPGRINSKLLDVLHRDKKPSGVKRSRDVSTVKFVRGIFPYVAPSSHLPSELITTGYIRKEFEKLKTAEEMIGHLQNIAGFNVTYNPDHTMSFNWASYPDAKALNEVGNDSLDIRSLTGPVVYKARIVQNGKTIQEIQSSKETLQQKISGLAANTDTQVCGYYGYKKININSNEACAIFKTPRDLTLVPSSSKATDYTAWAKANNIRLETRSTKTSDASQWGLVEKIVDTSGQNIAGTQIDKGSSVILYVYGLN
ncbi:transglycosylase domain-containing protein [Bulleidia sp. zg-1006]|uniref:transglycosylase domain-containing protein n=1 Tax=Bulleidia sp. zg-1006 TaxID=2806552 RepID=UPI00193972EB|nr:transglycosylase domain-containing protein [Bulleidia sp. zg-1006]QRG87111.1 penicillin-binding protein [Bulleidia sp. zg-1006]